MRESGEVPIQRGERELLVSRVESKHALAQKFGITMRYQIRDLNDSARPVISEHEPREPMYAASINKLLVARAVIVSAAQQDSLVQDETRRMLQDSDNEAAAALVRHLSPEFINALAADTYDGTRLHIRSDGSFHLGITTPQDALDILSSLVDITDEASELAVLARASLEDSHSRYGVRPRLKAGQEVVLFNKSGQINEDEELRRQYGHDLYRHDVGIIRNGARRIGYAIMAEGTAESARAKKLQAWLANSIIGQLGERMAEATEFQPHARIGTGAGLARRAIFSSGDDRNLV